MESMFCCPLCSQPLTREEHTYRCPNRHSYDISKEGYTYLLPVNRKNSAAPGDDKGMAAARRDFLSKEYYSPLLNTLCNEISTLAGDAPVLLDTGCGEGYYTAGIDISKFILRSAAKRSRDIEFAVASSYHLPVADESIHLLLNCFSPLAADEFRRVLKPGGAFLYVVPAADHLWEMKQVLYDEPYRNEEKLTPYEGFRYEEVIPVDAQITLDSQEDIHNLFQMTPYYWKTSKEGAARLAALEQLTTRISFRIHVFRKA